MRIIEEALLPPAAPQKFLVADAELPVHRMPVCVWGLERMAGLALVFPLTDIAPWHTGALLW